MRDWCVRGSEGRKKKSPKNGVTGIRFLVSTEDRWDLDEGHQPREVRVPKGLAEPELNVKTPLDTVASPFPRSPSTTAALVDYDSDVRAEPASPTSS